MAKTFSNSKFHALKTVNFEFSRLLSYFPVKYTGAKVTELFLLGLGPVFLWSAVLILRSKAEIAFSDRVGRISGRERCRRADRRAETRRIFISKV